MDQSIVSSSEGTYGVGALVGVVDLNGREGAASGCNVSSGSSRLGLQEAILLMLLCTKGE